MNRRQFVAAAAALPVVVRAGIARAGGTPLALVTADAEALLVAYGLSERRVLRRLPVLPGPRSIESVGDAAVVAHTAAGAVTILEALRGDPFPFRHRFHDTTPFVLRAHTGRRRI